MSQRSVPAAQTELLNNIHKVEGFDPSAFAVDYTDLNTQETRKRLPVMAQIAWFRLVYREGKIAVSVEQKHDYFVATARVYPSYKDPAECYLAEATASRGPDPSKPSVSPREWAQTAAVGIALRNAGFGVQFGAAGDDFNSPAANEFGIEFSPLPVTGQTETGMKGSEIPASTPAPAPAVVPELTLEQKYQQAVLVKCPIKKHKDRTLGEVLAMDAEAINWLANRYTGDPDVIAAAKVICEYAVQQASA